MVSNSKIPKAIVAYLKMPDNELLYLMDEYPYYTMPKIAYAIKHKESVNEKDIELYGYEKNIVEDWLTTDANTLIEESEKAQHKETIKIQQATTTSTNTTSKTIDKQVKTDSAVKKEDTSESTKTKQEEPTVEPIEADNSSKSVSKSNTEISQNTSKGTEEDKSVTKSEDDTDFLFDLDDDTIEFDMTLIDDEPVEQKEEKKTSVEKSADIKTKKNTKKKKSTTKKKTKKSSTSKSNTSKESSDKDESKDFFSWLNTTKHESHEDVGLDDISEIEAELDEDFIQKEIDKKKIKKTNKTIDKSIDESLDEPTIITETMAKIYADQGNKEKAIDIYNKLIVKFPEKSTYFASSIEKLKNE